jgi:hypothetical protein
MVLYFQRSVIFNTNMYSMLLKFGIQRFSGLADRLARSISSKNQNIGTVWYCMVLYFRYKWFSTQICTLCCWKLVYSRFLARQIELQDPFYQNIQIPVLYGTVRYCISDISDFFSLYWLMSTRRSGKSSHIGDGLNRHRRHHYVLI